MKLNFLFVDIQVKLIIYSYKWDEFVSEFFIDYQMVVFLLLPNWKVLTYK